MIPKTQLSPGLVNDKRTIKGTADVKNPLGLKNKTEQFERNPIAHSSRDHAKSTSKDEIRTRNTSQLPKPKADWEKDRSNKDRDDNRDKSVSKPNSKPTFEKPRSSNRDSQFKRNESNSQKQYSPFLNPYYKGRPREDDSDSRNFDPRDPRYREELWKQYNLRNNGSDPRDRDYNSSPRNDSSDRYQDVNPKYRDEAKKYFERFDQKNQSRPDSSRPESSSKSYEQPRRDYKAPESRGRDYKPSNNNNNSRSSRPSNNNNEPNKPHN